MWTQSFTHLASLEPDMGLLSLNSFWKNKEPSSKNITSLWAVIAVQLRKSPLIQTFAVEKHIKQATCKQRGDLLDYKASISVDISNPSLHRIIFRNTSLSIL
jgi:hypothetical protein